MLGVVKSFVNNKYDILEHGMATGAAIISRVSMLLITLMNTQYLSPQEFGLFALLLLVANGVIAFVSCGGDMWLNRFSRARHAKFEKAPIVSRFYFQISLVLALFVVGLALGMLLFANSYPNVGNHKVNVTIAFCLLWSATSGLIESVLAILRSTKDIHRFFFIRDMFLPLILMSAIFILKIDTALEFFMLAFTFWFITLLFLLKYLFNRSTFYLPTSYWTWKLLRKPLIAYTLNLVINNFTSRLANGIDTLLLARIMPLDIVGRYRFMAHFSNAFTVIQHFIFLPLPWHFRKQKSAAALNNQLQVIHFRNNLLLFTAFPALLICIILAKPALAILGAEYQAMAGTFCVLLIIRFCELLWGPQHETLISNNEVLEDTKANVWSLVLGIILFFAIIQYLSILKAALITVAAGTFFAQFKRFCVIRNKIRDGLQHKFPVLQMVITLTVILYVCFSK